VNAKNVHVKLTLPATLRTHSDGGLQTSGTPPSAARVPVNTSGTTARARAITGQAHSSRKAWASEAIEAKATAPQSIHR
jgi:hypothetical protein